MSPQRSRPPARRTRRRAGADRGHARGRDRRLRAEMHRRQDPSARLRLTRRTRARGAVEAGYDVDRVLTTSDLVWGEDVFFAATGVTHGELLRGVRLRPPYVRLVVSMRSRSGAVREINARHHSTRSNLIGRLSWRALPSHAVARRRDRPAARVRARARAWTAGSAGSTPPGARPAAAQLWITTRMTHVFALGDLLGVPGCGPLADHGLRRSATRSRTASTAAGSPSRAGPAHDKEAYRTRSSCSPPRARRSPAARRAAAARRARASWSSASGPRTRARARGWDRAWREPEAYRGANANMHRVEAFLAARDATGDPMWAQRALRIAERLIATSPARTTGGSSSTSTRTGHRCRSTTATRSATPFRPFGVTPGHGLEWSRLLLQLRSGLDESRTGSSRPRRGCSPGPSPTAGRRTAASSTRPGSTGSRS